MIRQFLLAALTLSAVAGCNSATEQQNASQIREGREQKTDMSRMHANKEAVEARGDDYAANENDYFDPSGAATKQEPVKVGPKIGRNDPCPCGSGKKYKQCHGKEA